MSNCTCKKAIPHDNGNCSKCGKQTGNGLMKKENGMELKAFEDLFDMQNVDGLAEDTQMSLKALCRIFYNEGRRTPSPSADKLIAAAIAWSEFRMNDHLESEAPLLSAIALYKKDNKL